MQFGVWVTGLGLTLGACGGRVAVESGQTPSGPPVIDSDSAHAGASGGADAAHAGASSSECPGLVAVGYAGPGTCAADRALINCTGPSADCSYLADDPAERRGCADQFPPQGCVSVCAADEYAMICEGPPKPDGGAYQRPPAKCRVLSSLGSGEFACCPCQ